MERERERKFAFDQICKSYWLSKINVTLDSGNDDDGWLDEPTFILNEKKIDFKVRETKTASQVHQDGFKATDSK